MILSEGQVFTILRALDALAQRHLENATETRRRGFETSAENLLLLRRSTSELADTIRAAREVKLLFEGDDPRNS